MRSSAEPTPPHTLKAPRPTPTSFQSSPRVRSSAPPHPTPTPPNPTPPHPTHPGPSSRHLISPALGIRRARAQMTGSLSAQCVFEWVSRASWRPWRLSASSRLPPRRRLLWSPARRTAGNRPALQPVLPTAAACALAMASPSPPQRNSHRRTLGCLPLASSPFLGAVYACVSAIRTVQPPCLLARKRRRRTFACVVLGCSTSRRSRSATPSRRRAWESQEEALLDGATQPAAIAPPHVLLPSGNSNPRSARDDCCVFLEPLLPDGQNAARPVPLPVCPQHALHLGCLTQLRVQARRPTAFCAITGHAPCALLVGGPRNMTTS